HNFKLMKRDQNIGYPPFLQPPLHQQKKFLVEKFSGPRHFRRRRLTRDNVVLPRTRLKKEAAILHDSVRAWITQWIGVIDAGIKISECEDLFRDVHRIHSLDVWPVEQRVGRNTAAVAEEQHVFGLRTKSQRKISKQTHLALVVRICSVNS